MLIFKCYLIFNRKIMTELENNEEKKDKLFRFSVWFFIFVLLVTLWMYFYKYNLDSSLSKTKNEISQIEKSVSELSSDKKIQVYSLYNANKSIIDNEFRKSDVNTYINYLKLTSRKYGVLFDTFNYDGAKIMTNIIATTTTDLAYLKMVKFISDYRTGTDDLVKLWFISSITWSDKINTNIVFELK